MRPIVEIYFYPRPPRGGRHNSLNGWATDIKFLSTPSARRATKKGHTERRRQAISIHALREEGDIPESYTELDGSVFLSTPSARRATTGLRRCPNLPEDFYPRPPRGGRPSRQTKMVSALRFLSTPSARRATRAFHSTVPGLRYFYPRPPRGGRQSCPHSRLQRLGISIHALREEGDLHPGDVDWPPVISIHALREEGDSGSTFRTRR